MQAVCVHLSAYVDYNRVVCSCILPYFYNLSCVPLLTKKTHEAAKTWCRLCTMLSTGQPANRQFCLLGEQRIVWSWSRALLEESLHLFAIPLKK